MAGKHVAVWPKVRVSANGKVQIIARGDLVPEGVSSVDLDNLVTFGAIAGVTGVVVVDDDTKAGSAAAVLAEVGDDKVKAQDALDLENAQEKPRKGLVSSLEKILGA